MAGIITDEQVVIVESQRGRLAVTTHASVIEAIKGMMQSGNLGGGELYGDEKHCAALDAIEAHLAYVRKTIRALDY